MNIAALLAELRRLDVRLKLDGDRLQISAPKGALDAEMRAELKERKEEILTFLRSASRSRGAEFERHEGEQAPVSFGQRRLWFLDQFSQGGAVYSIPGAVRLRGSLQAVALRKTLDQILERHAVLRTTFHEDNGEIVQKIGPIQSMALTMVDLRDREVAEREQEISRIVEEESSTPFDLALGPLVRARLVRVDELEHVLILNIHHIVADGWSMAVIVRELGALYAKFSCGTGPDLEPLPFQYSDFAIWQQSEYTSAKLDSLYTYWRDALDDRPPVLDLAIAQPRLPTQSYAAATCSLRVSRELRERLETLSRDTRVTLFMTLLAAFKLLLSRYSGETDILVGSPIANRQRTELDGMIGFFLNTLVLRTDLSGEPTFLELMGRVRDTTLGAFSHQDMPFEELVARLNPERSASHAPVFQSMFVLQNAPAEPVQLGDLEIELLELESRSSEYDLDMQVLEDGTGLRLFLRYSQDLFAEHDVERLLRHYRNLLESIVDDPNAHISQLTMLGDEEVQRQLVEWNDTAAANSDLPTHRQIAAIAEATPDAVAVECADTSLTYAELLGRVGTLAATIRAAGVEPNDRVGICVDRSERMLTAMLAVWELGASYVPLDPTFPEERLRFMIEDADLALVLCDSAVSEVLPAHSVPRLLIDDPPAEFSEELPTDRLEDPAAVAYVIYTSGSSGQPKGVAVEHRQVTNFLAAMTALLEPSSATRFLALTTVSFDISVLEMFLPLVTGGRVQIGDGALATDTRRLGKLLASGEVNVFQATPTVWRMLIDSGWSGSSSLVALCGGEPLSADLATSLVSRCGTLWNLYGPTETTVWSLAKRVEEPVGAVSIGRPIANTQVFVLDAAMNVSPIGVPGELFIAGDGVARGYLDRPELTSERFVPNPFNEDGSRMYRTGDLVRYRADGDIEFLRRVDYQVKLRGFRIELGEIERRLEEVEEVEQAVVIVREMEAGDERLVAYLIAREGETPSASQLRRHLEQMLPEYMIPAHFICLGEFPKTANAKIDRRRLPAPDVQRPALDVDYVPPTSDTERDLASAWATVLKLDRVGIEDNFFELGGNSLLLVQLQREVEQAAAHTIPLVEFFRSPTVAALSRFLEGDGASDASISAARSRMERQREALASRRRWN